MRRSYDGCRDMRLPLVYVHAGTAGFRTSGISQLAKEEKMKDEVRVSDKEIPPGR